MLRPRARRTAGKSGTAKNLISKVFDVNQGVWKVRNEPFRGVRWSKVDARQIWSNLSLRAGRPDFYYLETLSQRELTRTMHAIHATHAKRIVQLRYKAMSE